MPGLQDYMLPVPDFAGKAINAYRAGREDLGQDNRLQAQQQLATDLPNAMTGDPQARGRTVASMAMIDPAHAAALNAQYAEMDAATLDRKMKQLDQAGPALQSVKDQAGLDQAKDYLINTVGMDPKTIGGLTLETLPNTIAMSNTARAVLKAHQDAELAASEIDKNRETARQSGAMADLWATNGGTVGPYGPVPNTTAVVPPPRGAPNAPPVTVGNIPPPSTAGGIVQEAGDPRGPVGTRIAPNAAPAVTPPISPAAQPSATTQPVTDWSKVAPDPNPTVRRIAERVHAGDDSAWAELGAASTRNPNTPLRNRVSAEVNRLFGLEGLGGADQSGAVMDRKAAQQEANRIAGYIGGLSTAIEEVDRFGPLAVAAAKDYGNTPFPGVNALMQFGSQQTGDPKLRKLGLAVASLANAYALVATRGNPNVNGQQAAHELFSKIDSWQALAAAAQQAQTEGISAKASAIQALKDARNRINGIQQQAREPTPPFPDDTTPNTEIPTHTLHGRPIVVRNGAWVFQDDGKPAK